MNAPLPKLFIPGPVDVAPSTYAALSSPVMGHRGRDFEELYAQTQEGLQALMGTARPVYLSTSSAWGVMEGAIRNLVNKRVLNLCCGAFSDKWYDVSLRCGKQADRVAVPWGEAITPQQVRGALEAGDYDVVTLVHNETSTGVMNDLEGIARVVQDFPDVLLVVDTVSSLSGVPIAMDDWGIDVLLAGVQKALAIPPGLAVFAVSEASLERASQTEGRGYYFDFIEFEKNGAKNNTPSTPALPHIYALVERLEAIKEEGLLARFARHEALNGMVHTWMERWGFEHFAQEGFRSKTLTAIANNHAIDVPAFIKALRERHGFLINGGYGKIKGTTMRISNMGNETEKSMQALFDALDDVLVDFLPRP